MFYRARWFLRSCCIYTTRFDTDLSNMFFDFTSYLHYCIAYHLKRSHLSLCNDSVIW